MEKKLKCLLLDDELPGLTYLKMLCEQHPELEVVKSFNNPNSFVSELSDLEFDLCFIDIEMPSMNGLQVAKLLQDKLIIFITAYKEFAADAFDLNAIDYIRKPVTQERLNQAIQKAIIGHRKLKKPIDFIQLNTDKGKTKIDIDKILVIRTSITDSRDKKFILTDGRELNVKNISFDRLLELLPIANFCRINKKELIALHSIDFFSFNEITVEIKNNVKHKLVLQLSEVYRKEFLMRYSN